MSGMMRSPEGRFALFIGAGLLVGALGGAMFSGDPVADGSAAADAPWSLPDAATLQRHDEADFAALRGNPFWGGATAESAGADGAARWTLGGIVRDGETWTVLVVPPGGGIVVQRATVGDALPDRAVVVAIDAASVTTRLGDCRRTYTLYRAPPPADACDSSAGP